MEMNVFYLVFYLFILLWESSCYRHLHRPTLITRLSMVKTGGESLEKQTLPTSIAHHVKDKNYHMQSKSALSIIAATAVTTAISGAQLPFRVNAVSGLSIEEFTERWPYQKPSDILPYIESQSEEGEVELILSLLDTFASYYPMYKLTKR